MHVSRVTKRVNCPFCAAAISVETLRHVDTLHPVETKHAPRVFSFREMPNFRVNRRLYTVSRQARALSGRRRGRQGYLAPAASQVSNVVGASLAPSPGSMASPAMSVP
jgi:hypothetical protein